MRVEVDQSGKLEQLNNGRSSAILLKNTGVKGTLVVDEEYTGKNLIIEETLMMKPLGEAGSRLGLVNSSSKKKGNTILCPKIKTKI